MAFDQRSGQLIPKNLLTKMPENGEPFVSIIIPSYNEAHRLEASITALDEFLRGADWSREVILVVEKSTDNTLAIARRIAATRPWLDVVGNEVQRGKGYAVKVGMLKARGDVAFFMDADLSTSLGEIDRFIDRFAAAPSVDVLVGNRQHLRSEITVQQGVLRRKMGQTFNAILRLITGIRLQDTQCGFKAFRRAAREAIFPLQRLDGFAFDVETLLLADRLGFAVEDMPVEWKNSAGSKVRIVRDSFRMLRDAIRVRRLIDGTPIPPRKHD